MVKTAPRKLTNQLYPGLGGANPRADCEHLYPRFSGTKKYRLPVIAVGGKLNMGMGVYNTLSGSTHIALTIPKKHATTT